VGSFYGATLARAGHEVHFLLRSDYERVRRYGVAVQSPKGDFKVRPKCAQRAEEIGVAELVLVALKTTANEQFGKLLPPLVGPQTAILTLQNGLGNEEALARLFPAEQILGGLCFVCLNRLQPGLIHHLDHGLVVVGEFQGWPEPRTHDIAGLFRHAGVPCDVTDNLARAHWEKLTWNIPFNGLGVASAAGFEAVMGGESVERGAGRGEHGRSDGETKTPYRHGGRGRAFSIASPLNRCLTTDKLLADARWAGLARELMLEVITAARALGHHLPESLADRQIERTRTMGAYRASTLIDFERGQPLEIETLFLEPLRQANGAGVAMPRLSALCRVLQQLDPGSSA
jgi:2-dehydropantoate 2-reductase